MRRDPPSLEDGSFFVSTLLNGADSTSMLAHIVYFTLKDPSPSSIDALVRECREYLGGEQGEVFFAVGTLCKELDRPVNDRDFHVALHVVFDSKESQDAYQTAPRHLEFIRRNKESWAKVRVFDSNC